ncbi:MAG TPA: NAD(+) synthase [Mycolicibacillus parakoreensis]|nr:NAD(+) synthase [Mycolicibacillus parakoreensis]
MSFYNAYRHGYARVAACTITTALGDPEANAAAVLTVAQRCHDDGVALAVFPELTLSGYSLDDITLQDTLLASVTAALGSVVAGSADLLPVLIIGAPLAHRNRVYNTAVVIHRGVVLGVVPKSYLPAYREFYEPRQFAAGTGEHGTIRLGGRDVPFGTDLLFSAVDLPGFVVHAEICEDMFVPVPPSAPAALAGATVLANLSSSPVTIGRAEERRLLARSASARCLAAYLYAAAGAGESSTDLAWDGQTGIFENGAVLAESERFPDEARCSIADIDLGLLRAERMRVNTFDDNRIHHGVDPFRRIDFRLRAPEDDLGLLRTVERFPFVPADPARLQQDCYEAYNIQVAGLEQRLRALNHPKIVLGVSGGLDSTHALIVAARAMDRGNRPRSDILAFTMPGFATSAHTKDNARALSEALGATFDEIDIRDSARLMLAEMGHPFARGQAVYDVTFENVQAGLRTDYLFRIANQRGGIVLGTGDLSELALGWSTYGVGDHMSHYNVNGGVPKTLIQHLIRWVISSGQFPADVSRVLASVLDTEISPELVPAADEHAVQRSEDTVGPYALQDFSLFYALRHGFGPAKIAFLAWHAWRTVDAGRWPPGYPETDRHAYTLAEIRHWLTVFVRRFYAFSQFKRSALPNGPKVSAGGSLSPRGDWRAPSDLSARIWLDEIDREIPEK